MADKDKKLSTVYSELKAAINSAESDVTTKDEAVVAARLAYDAARQDLLDKRKRLAQLETMYPELKG
tara:strand:+ start:778 stop:978 length:201 start_codon:yes stop_codon:yes gene_type:complete